MYSWLVLARVVSCYSTYGFKAKSRKERLTWGLRRDASDRATAIAESIAHIKRAAVFVILLLKTRGFRRENYELGAVLIGGIREGFRLRGVPSRALYSQLFWDIVRTFTHDYTKNCMFNYRLSVPVDSKNGQHFVHARRFGVSPTNFTTWCLLCTLSIWDFLL